MHLVNSATMPSLRQASAHSVHASLHSMSVSIVAASSARSRLIDWGYVSSIGRVVLVMMTSNMGRGASPAAHTR
jgi:hypothetical protein